MIREKEYYGFENSMFNYIVLGLVLFALGDVLRLVTGSVIAAIISCIIGWYFILKGYISIKGSLGFNVFSKFYCSLLQFYLFLCVVMILRGYTIDYEYQWISSQGMLNYHFIQKYYILPYLMPLVCFIPWQYYKFDKIVKFATWAALISIVIFIVYFPTIISSSLAAKTGGSFDRIDSGLDFRFYAAFAFVTLLVAYIPNKTWLINVLGLITVILINMIAARRGSSLMLSILLLGTLYFWSKNKEWRNGLYAKIVCALLLGLAVYFVLNSSLFDYLFQRGMQDSRSGVDDALLKQMSSWELFWGKGLNGRYYYPILFDDYWKGWRYGSETGFFNIVLKGGYLMAFTYILLLAIPAFKGMFKSNNYLCKAGGFFILLSLLELYPFGWLEFSIKFLIIWMFVPICMNQQVREMDDEQIMEQFF